MAILKTDIKRVTVSMPKTFVKDLDTHLKQFALTDRGRWLLEAAKEKLSQEKILLQELKEEEGKED